jgi:AcrR family transcriptional regulator
METARTETPRKSDITRAAILAAARCRFAEDGYDQATIRAIAAEARIDAALVMRYFGSKENLFSAAAVFDLELPDWSDTPDAELGQAVARHFVDRWNADDAFKVLLRASPTSELAVSRMQEVLSGQLEPVIRKLVSDPATAPLRAALITSQVLGMALARTVMRFPPLISLERDQVASILGPVFQHYLRGRLDADLPKKRGAPLPR